MRDLSKVSEKLTLGICQIHILRGDGPEGDKNIARNINEMSELIDEAAAKGAELVVLPEYWACGCIDRDTLQRIAELIPGGRFASFLIEKAKQHNIYINGGSVPEKLDGGRIGNTNIFIDPNGNILSKYSKVHLYSPLSEHLAFTPGDSFKVTNTPWGNFGTLICFDGDFPEDWRIMKLMGADMVFEVACYESPCETWWTDLYKAHAITNTLWICQVCAVGKCTFPTDVNFFGMSRIVAPNGRVVAEGTYYPPETPLNKMKSEVLTVTVNLREELEKASAQKCFTTERDRKSTRLNSSHT
jgi:predicted amidohydrolase